MPDGAPPQWRNVRQSLAALQPWERNPRRLSKAAAQRLLKSWQSLGQFQTVAIGPAGEVYDGHQRLSVLMAVYGAEYEIDARQSDRALSEVEREQITLAANLPAGAWNWETLAGWQSGLLAEWFDGAQLENWKDNLAAGRELLRGVRGGYDFIEAEADPPAPPPSAEADAMRALAIVLTPAEYARWVALKAEWGVQTDKAAWLKLLERRTC